jgi:VanZ family protein
LAKLKFFIIFIVILADMGRMPRFISVAVEELPYGDKVAHFILFGILNFFITRAAISTFSSRDALRVALLAGFILALLVGLEEFSQNYFSERTAEWVDLFAGYAGMFIGGMVAFKWRARG